MIFLSIFCTWYKGDAILGMFFLLFNDAYYSFVDLLFMYTCNGPFDRQTVKTVDTFKTYLYM